MTQSSTALSATLLQDIRTTVQWALKEDVGDGDITAALIPTEQTAKATVIVREAAVICGTAWVEEVFRQVDPKVNLQWAVQDGDGVEVNQTLLTAQGNARSLLTAERCALNFLQTLSATATLCRQYADIVTGTSVKLLDTRKTIPGLRSAQKYAVTCGGCYNHRIGLFDAYLIKENHIQACGGIPQAIQTAKANQPGKPVEIEVENFDELSRAIEAGADRIMLDNFSVEEIIKAVNVTQQRAELEASGGINKAQLRAIAETGVDYISIGALTKSCQAIDLSMRFASDS